MRKLILFWVAALFAVANLYAQNSFASFAALEHNGNITMFTGGQALEEAVQAADNGDVITLSAGAFDNQITLTKSITLRGAGMDVKSGKNITIVNASIILDFNTAPTASFVFEGIDIRGIYSYSAVVSETDATCITSGSITVNKCFVRSEIQIDAKNVVITDSKILGLKVNGDASVRCHNSVICGAYTPYGTTYTNCVVVHGGYGTYERCICAGMHEDNYTYPFTLCPAKDCIYILDKSDIPVSAINVDITYVVNWSDVFDFEEFLEEEYFIAQHDFTPKQSGYYTYSPLLNLPTIKNLIVAKETTDDGKLSIDVEIED